MKKVMFLMIVVFSLEVHAQVNLVSNPSFEIYDTCPINQGQIGYASGWENYGNSPDYFNVCSGNYEFSVPLNWGGYQNAAHGGAYCALGTYAPYYPSTREFVSANLIVPLQPGLRYYVSFKVCLSISDYIQSYSATNNLGALFTNNQYSWSNPPALNNFAHVNCYNIVTDTTIWTTVFGSFIADSAYQRIILGNFYDDQNTSSIIYVDTIFNFAYYYIDEVCVSTDSVFAQNYVTGLNEISRESLFSIYPNPTNSKIDVRLSDENTIYSINIFDSQGKIVHCLIDVYGNTSFNLSQHPPGLYSVVILTKDHTYTHKLIKT